MKKAITAILTGIFALGTAFGASGCKDNNIPIKGELYVNAISYNNFEELKMFYNDIFQNENIERLFLINPGDHVLKPEHNNFVIVGDKLENYKFINPYIYEEYYVFYEELGDLDGEQKILGKYSYSFKVGAKFYPVSSMAEIEKLQFKFDKASLTFTIKNGDELVGECTFKTEIEITEEWYQNYIKTNLTFWR